MKTKALALIRHGEADSAFQEMEITLPSLRKKQVLVEVEAFGLNYAEVMARRGLYGDAPPMPAVLGYEAVGKIIEVGEETNAGLIGQRVLAFCRFGGYAQHVITEEHAIVEIHEMDAGVALALATQYVTAFYMVEHVANVSAFDKVLVHAAAGGVGTALIQLCKQKGARVFAKVSNEEKASLVKSLGADYAINYRKSDYEVQIASILQNDTLDVSFNPVAGATTKKDARLLGAGSRLVLFGGSELGKAKYGIFSKLNFVRKMGMIIPIGLMMRSRSVCGVNLLRIADNKPLVLQHCLKTVVQMAKENKVQPQVGRIFAWDQISEAHAFLESGKSTGKLVILTH